jgi:Ring finger domain
MTVELCKNYFCIAHPQGIIGITLVCLGFLKYIIILSIIIFYCVYFRTTRNVNGEDLSMSLQDTDNYLDSITAPMPNNDPCSICMESNEEVSVRLECDHYFHKNCLRDWVRIKGSCPMCRRLVFN